MALYIKFVNRKLVVLLVFMLKDLTIKSYLNTFKRLA